jgi:uncharacterized Fe-S cluster protein YjdI
VVKQYTNGEITVVWKPDVCEHTGVCVRGLHEVFDPQRRPWIQLQSSDSATIAAQVERCPSGALAWFRNEPDGA